MHSKRRIASLVALAGAAAIVMIVPGLAAGATATYAPHSQSRSFHTGDGGWRGSVRQDGLLCVAPVTCPTVTPSFVNADGAGGAGDGHLRVAIGGLTNVLTVSRGVYRSPTFKYEGVGGKRPKRLRFTMDRRTRLAGLLNIPNAAADQTVALVDVTRGTAVTITNRHGLRTHTSWAKVPAVKIDPSRLKVGDRYRIRLIAAFTTPIAVIPSSTVDYDNVVLTAKRPRSTGAGGPSGGHDGQFATQVGKSLGPAALMHTRLYVRVGCPRSAAPHQCRMKVTPRLRKGGPKVARTRRLHAAAGAKGYVRLKVRHRFRARLEHRERIWVKETVTAGHHRAKVTKQVKLRRR